LIAFTRGLSLVIHSYSHPAFSKITLKEAEEEIRSVEPPFKIYSKNWVINNLLLVVEFLSIF